MKEKHCHEKIYQAKRGKIAGISCLKISIFCFSWGTSHEIPQRKRKSWRKTSHTSHADFLHKRMPLQTSKAQIVEQPDGANIRLQHYWLRTHFQQDECISKIMVTLMYYPDFPLFLSPSPLSIHIFLPTKCTQVCSSLYPESGLALKCISISLNTDCFHCV